MTLDLTKGSIWKNILLFTIPLIASNFLQQLYNMVDLIFAGQVIAGNASAAIGTSSRLILCLINFLSGLAIGAGVAIAQYFGSKDLKMANKTIGNALLLSLTGGSVFSILAYFASEPYIYAINTPSEIIPEAIDYLQVYSLSLICILFYNIGAAILRALGDSRRPLIAQAVAGTVNIFLDALFTIIFPLGVRGIAIASLISQGLASIYVLYRVLKIDFIRFFKEGFPQIDFGIIKEIIRVGLPSGIQSFLITFSNVIGQYYINHLSIAEITAFTYFNKLDNLTYIPVVSLGQAAMTFTAQNFGAGNISRIKKGIKIIISSGVILIACISLFVVSTGRFWISIFTNDEEIIAATLIIMRWLFPLYFIYIFLQVLGDCMRGLGRAKSPMNIVIINMCILRSFLFYFLVPHYQSIGSVCIIYPITWITTSVCMGIQYLRIKKKILIDNTSSYSTNN